MSKTTAILLFSIHSLLFLSSCSLVYVVKQGVYQVELVAGAEPIYQALRSSTLTPTQRKKLELILDVREFCRTKLQLVADRNYKDVNLAWDKPIHTVSASYPLQFKPYHWWFPIVGSVPYKGFFDEKDAHREEQKLIAGGFETQKRKISGYSTLGFFSDPVWPSMLTLSDDALIELIIHELAHATVYINNETPFNETFASFVGKMGAIAYVHDRFGKDSAQAKKLATYYDELEIYRSFFYDLYVKLDEIYQSSHSDNDKKNRKHETLKNAKQAYLATIKNESLKKIDWNQVNNAYLLSFKRYNQDDVVFANLLAAVGGNFSRFIDEVNFYARTGEPFSSLKARVATLSKKI